MSTYIHPDWLQLEQELGYRPVLLGSIESIRAASMQIADTLNLSYAVPSPVPKIDDRIINSGVRVRVYTPIVADCGPPPLGVYFHSGGWSSGSIEAEDATCIHLACKLPAVIISVGYRLAPEFKSPTAHNDAVDAVTWAWENASSLGGDSRRLFTIGGSAGGNLAIYAALKAIDRKINIAGVVAIVPVTVHPDAVPAQYKSSYKSYLECVDSPIINKESMEIFFDNYGSTATDPFVSVLCNPRIGELPRTYLVSCTADPLRDDARLLKRELDRQKIANKMTEYEGMPHYFWIFPQLKQRAEFLDDLVNGVRFILRE